MKNNNLLNYEGKEECVLKYIILMLLIFLKSWSRESYINISPKL